MDDDG
jgi:hypothetical protein